jgi:hypothetical protein
MTVLFATDYRHYGAAQRADAAALRRGGGKGGKMAAARGFPGVITRA